jgi:hypothetical protein
LARVCRRAASLTRRRATFVPSAPAGWCATAPIAVTTTLGAGSGWEALALATPAGACARWCAGWEVDAVASSPVGTAAAASKPASARSAAGLGRWRMRAGRLASKQTAVMEAGGVFTSWMASAIHRTVAQGPNTHGVLWTAPLRVSAGGHRDPDFGFLRLLLGSGLGKCESLLAPAGDGSAEREGDDDRAVDGRRRPQAVGRDGKAGQHR